MGNFLSGNLGQTKCRATRRSGNSLLTAVAVASLGVMLMAAPRAASAMINVGGWIFLQRHLLLCRRRVARRVV